MIHRTRVISEPFGYYGVRCIEPCIWQRRTVSRTPADARALGTAHAKTANAANRKERADAEREPAP